MSIQRATDAEQLFADLGAASAVVFAATVGAADQHLVGEELALVSTMSPDRRADFIAGRAAARAGLVLLGFAERAVLIGPGGEPLWPAGVIGSITHAGGMALAAVAKADDIRSSDAWSAAIGIDLEERGRIGNELLPLILTDVERSTWTGMDSAAADTFATASFSAKEALYKAQFVLTGAWLGFEHVSRNVAAPTRSREATGATVAIDLTFDESADSPLDTLIERPLRARSLISANRVVSAVVLRRPTSPKRSR